MQSQACFPHTPPHAWPPPPSHRAHSPPPPGATGFVGSRLVSRLAAQGSIVNVLTRNVQRAKSVLPYPNVQYFDPRDWQAGIENTAGVVNLAGEPISTRWTPEIKKEIKASRVQTTSKIVDIINRLEPAQRPPVLVSSSAVGMCLLCTIRVHRLSTARHTTAPFAFYRHMCLLIYQV